MFAGLMGIERCPNSLRHRCEVVEGGRTSGTAGSSTRKRLHRRPGYMRAEQSRTHITVPGQEQEVAGWNNRNGKPGHHTDVTEVNGSQMRALQPAFKVSIMNQTEPDRLMCSSWKITPVQCRARKGSSSHQGPMNELSLSPNSAVQSSPQDSFNSSFSFIQQSLNSSQTAESTPSRQPEPINQTTNAPQTKPPFQSLPSNIARSHADGEELSLGRTFWRECLFDSKEVPPDVPECDSQDIEITSSLSVDSDNASASSVTSGYESTTPASDQGWDNLVKKYEEVLQDCLQNNRTYTKIESMMLKLQRLQQKAILDDDYDSAERFGKKLEELSKERGALRLGLPSTQPSVALFLERLVQVVHSALQRAECGQCRGGVEPDAGERSDSLQGPLLRRERLIQERKLVEEEIAELQQRLTELGDRSRCLEQQIQQEEQRAEAEELEGSMLRSSTVAQLRNLSQTLQDLVTSENRTQISVSPLPSTLRLQEQEQALNLSIKEATAKVVMSQRLGSSLRRKVSETETQLLALYEAKLAAISGNDFSSAKELKAEMKAVYLERDRLEALAKRLHGLSSGSSQELVRMKEQQQQLRQELEQKEAQHDSRLKENTTKYMKLLEDRLHSCACHGLERIWEADLEACHLFLRGLQLRTPSCSGADAEDLPLAKMYLPPEPCSKEEEDCAMLTALGGRWCPEANLQNSEFTKKLEEFLFGMEDNHTEDEFSEAEAADLAEHCELISDRLMTLEDELQTAILNRDLDLTQSLEKEVQEVKATLQTMFAQLKEEEQELKDNDLMKSGTEEEEEDEDQYFSDSWDI